MKDMINWIMGVEQYTKRSPKDRLILKISVTAKCRFNAELRLMYLAKITFLTTTFMSLGMIFIPLIQHSEVKLGYPTQVLDMLQVFFAVSVLVYSVISSTANYKHRALLLRQCGNRLKSLQGRILSSISTEDSLDAIATEYENILNSSEEHDEVDYMRTKLQMNEYKITGVKWLLYHFCILLYYIKVSIVPIIMAFLEVIIIIDNLYHFKIIKPFCIL